MAISSLSPIASNALQAYRTTSEIGTDRSGMSGSIAAGGGAVGGGAQRCGAVPGVPATVQLLQSRQLAAAPAPAPALTVTTSSPPPLSAAGGGAAAARPAGGGSVHAHAPTPPPRVRTFSMETASNDRITGGSNFMPPVTIRVLSASP